MSNVKISQLSGGFLLHKQQAIRAGLSAHTSAVESAVSPEDLNALNYLQSVPWRICEPILWTLENGWEQGVLLPGIEKAAFYFPQGYSSHAEWMEHIESGNRTMSDEQYAALSEDEKREFKQEISSIFKHNMTATSCEFAILDFLDVAQELRGRKAIWYPHNFDFRLRKYPIVTSGPHPQSSDLGKSLIEFSEGVPLGPDGVYWLLVRAGTNAGMDKASFDERMSWALDNKTKIIESAEDPLYCQFWQVDDKGQEREDAWAFLAVCFALAKMWSLGDSVADWQQYVNHTPVYVDGTCNGAQNIAAMSLDADLAKSVNLRSYSNRQDLYSDVARICAGLVEEDAQNGVEEALLMRGYITRDTVKQPTMTKFYGVTDRGIRRQVLSKEKILAHVKDRKEKAKCASYLQIKISQALRAVMGRGEELMNWLSQTAEVLAKAGLPLEWITPTGSIVRQAYYESTMSRVKTMRTTVCIFEENKNAGLRISKQRQSAAPNFVHSYDAALVTRVANRMAAMQYPLTSIHDSFGCQPAHMRTMLSILREEFHRIYTRDPLAETEEYIRAYAPHVKLPDLPPRGNLDISEILSSDWLFS